MELDWLDQSCLAMAIIGALLIGFAWLDDFIVRHWNPTDRIIWLRRLGLRAWR